MGDTRLKVAFQPIYSLAGRALVGYEALARFDDGRPPADVFELARRSGVAVALEIDAVVAALRAAEGLPADVWLSCNLSAATILSAPMVLDACVAVGRRVVVEITEHEHIADYPALRHEFAARPSLQIAVDDAGAGYASLGHVLALAPHFVKLDHTWVSGVAEDPVRRALVGSLASFAVETGMQLIAEGLETAQDLDAVRDAGVTLGQGYLLGRPVLAVG